MVNVQYYCFLTNIITKTKICESETTFFNFVNLPKREKIPLKGPFHRFWHILKFVIKCFILINVNIGS